MFAGCVNGQLYSNTFAITLLKGANTMSALSSQLAAEHLYVAEKDNQCRRQGTNLRYVRYLASLQILMLQTKHDQEIINN